MSTARIRVLLGFAAFGALWGTWGAVLPQLQRHARVDDAQLGTALLFVGVGALLSIRLAGGLADRYPRATLPCTFAALGVAGALPAVVVGAVALSTALLILGVSSGAADAAINAAAARIEATGSAALNLGHGMFSAAVVLASLGVSAFGTGRTGPPSALLVVAALLLVVAVVAALLRTGLADGRSASPSPHRISWPLVVLGLFAALAYLVENAWQSWGAIQLHSTLGASLQIAALAPAVFAGFAAVGRFAGHRLTSRFPAATLLVAGASLAAAASLLAALAHTVPLALIGIGAAGLGTSVCAPTLIAVAGRLFPAASGAATSAVITLAYLGFVLGPAAVGLLSGATTLPTALTAVALVGAGLAVISPTVRNLDPA